MDELARILLHVNAGQPDHTQLAVHLDGYASSGRVRLIVLGDLVALGKIGVEVVFTGEGRHRLDLAAQCKCRPHRELDGMLVDHRQHARHTQVHLGGLRIGLRPEAVRRAAKELCLGAQLCVNFESYDRLPVR